ncbi:MAG: nitroreductase [Bulleidia sp.]|nr:nitroreductase [Bulleidia sp.]
MNEVIRTIESRRSCRNYREDPVPKAIIDQVVEAGTYAASGMGKQSPIILEILNKDTRDQLSRMNAQIMGTRNDPFYGAPYVLVVLADRNMPTHVYDGSLVLGNMMIAAESLGLGACWIHRAKEEFESEEGKKLLKYLGVQGDYEGIGHLILGWPATQPNRPAERKQNYVYTAD